ncbi:MAG: glycosylhydrolase-like jelly roll fold domain-containing protein, partial [Actinopolymorphaceae bacterium]
EKDPFQAVMLGPKARVPDDFWHVAGVKAGQVVVFRTSLPVERAGTVTLAVEANGAKDIWWNGEPLGPDPGGFLRLDEVRTRAGSNLLEVHVTADARASSPIPTRDLALRGYWALTTDPDAYARPAWLMPDDGTVRGTELMARGTLTLPAAAVRATLQLGTEGPAQLFLTGKEIATQGAFEPYGGQGRVLPYDIAEHLVVGDNPIEVRFTDIGRPLAVFVDALVACADGTTSTFVTDASSWTFARDGVPVRTALRRLQPYDPRFAWLRPRPHPLPRASWLEAAVDDGSVLDLVPEARPGLDKPAEWFRIVVPPGATSATIPVAWGRVQVWLDGVEIPVSQGRVVLRRPEIEGRILAVRIEPADGRSGGALWDGPLEFECGEGLLSAGPWADAGLGSYSGGVRYRRQVHLDTVPGSAVLDLGAVRGTAEVVVNGQHAGVRIWSPWRLDVSGLLRAGVNDVEVTVYNTLAPYLDDCSPTMGVFPGQRLSGLLGPVTLRTATRRKAHPPDGS